MDGQQETIERARRDLARRLQIPENEVGLRSIAPVDFPDAALGAPTADEMSAQVITPGWRIQLDAQNESYEYRAAGKSLRLYNFSGKNYRL
jgi:hypothetical protein